MARKRKGNLLLFVIIFFFLVLTVTGLFTINAAQKSQARIKAVTATQANSLLTVGRLHADMFVDDLAKSSAEVVGSVGSIDETLFTADDYRAALSRLQDNLGTAAPGLGPTVWYYRQNSDPTIPFRQYGLDLRDDDLWDYLDTLLYAAEVTIVVHEELNFTDDTFGNVLNFRDGDVVVLNAITFDVILTKGSWKVEQQFELTGMKFTASYDHDGRPLLQGDGTDAKCTMESQYITRLSGINSELHVGDE